MIGGAFRRMFLLLLLLLMLPFKASSFHTGFTGILMPIKFVGALAFIYAIWYRAVEERVSHYFGTWQARLFFLFLIVVCVSAIRAPRYSTMPALSVLSLVVLYFTLLTVVDKLERLRAVLITVIVSIGLASLYSVRAWVVHRGWETGFRPGYVIDSNHFPITAVCGIALAWYLAQDRKFGRLRWVLWLCMLVDIAAILTGASRGGFLGLSVTVLIILARSRKRIRNLLLFSALIIGFNLAYSHSPLQRLLHPDLTDKYSSMAHRASWAAGYRMLYEHPVLGIGLGRFKSEMNEYAPSWYDHGPTMAHNAFVSVAAEMGLPGILLYIGIIITTYRSLDRISRMKSAPKIVTHTAVALQAAFVGECVSVSFIPAAYHEYLWLVIFLSVCLPPLAIRFRRRPRRDLRSVESNAASALELVQV